MKNATKHAEELRSLNKKLVREHKPGPREPMDALKALVRGAMSYEVSDAKADEAMRAIDREFVDLNELRVATDLEIQELLGTRYPLIEKRVAMITQSLNDIFERMTRPFLRPIRRWLRRFDTAGIDWSPLVLMLIIFILRQILAVVARRLILSQ